MKPTPKALLMAFMESVWVLPLWFVDLIWYWQFQKEFKVAWKGKYIELAATKIKTAEIW